MNQTKHNHSHIVLCLKFLCEQKNKTYLKACTKLNYYDYVILSNKGNGLKYSVL